MYKIVALNMGRMTYYAVMKEGFGTSSHLFGSRREAEEALTKALATNPNIEPTKI